MNHVQVVFVNMSPSIGGGASCGRSTSPSPSLESHDVEHAHVLVVGIDGKLFGVRDEVKIRCQVILDARIQEFFQSVRIPTGEAQERTESSRIVVDEIVDTGRVGQ